MRRRLALLVTAGALLAVPAAEGSTAFAGNGITAHAACKSAVIGGQRKCIARGQYCARASQRDYLRYGLSCTQRDARGRYRLQ